MSYSDQLAKLAKKIQENGEISETDKKHILHNINSLSQQKINILITGATGCGKSSTINALFETEKAKVGVSPSPETMDVSKYELDNMIIWDSPGLGDGKDADELHKRNIVHLLKKEMPQIDKNDPPKLLIDLVLVIIDGSTRDLGTSYDLINDTIIPNLGEDKGRILIAINQADAAMKGRYWDAEKRIPEKPLVDFLEQKVLSIKKRIKDSTGVDVDPIYYSAGFKEEGKPQEPPYNISKLLYYIISKIPDEKRLLVHENINKYSWHTTSQGPNEKDYKKKIKDSVKESTEKSLLGKISTGVANGAAAGRAVGAFVPVIGPVVGTIVGGIIGGAIQAIRDCYITTSTCESFGKPDDCYELAMFRNFRDRWLLNQPDGKALISEYYDTAPKIVENIDRHPNQQQIYEKIWCRYLNPCLALLEHHNYQACKDKYIEMVKTLQNFINEDTDESKQL